MGVGGLVMYAAAGTRGQSRLQLFGLQGVLYLTDTAEDQGRTVRAELSPNVLRMGQDAAGGSPFAAARAAGTGGQTDRGLDGDLFIWHRLLLHGNGRNLPDKPRFAQYINMSPVGDSTEKQRSGNRRSRGGRSGGRRPAGRETSAIGSINIRNQRY